VKTKREIEIRLKDYEKMFRFYQKRADIGLLNRESAMWMNARANELRWMLGRKLK
jgi:hypothetical protein